MELPTNEYVSYYEPYMKLVKGEIGAELKMQFQSLPAFLLNIPKEKELFRYAPDKWTVKEAIGHIIDTERVMAFRALSIARMEPAPLPRFDEDKYVLATNFNNREMDELINDFEVMRISNISLFNSLTKDEVLRMGVASGHDISVRALFQFVVGHAAHHVNIFKERYLI